MLDLLKQCLILFTSPFYNFYVNKKGVGNMGVCLPINVTSYAKSTTLYFLKIFNSLSDTSFNNSPHYVRNDFNSSRSVRNLINVYSLVFNLFNWNV